MLEDVPDATRVGVAVLRGWRRDISAMLAGNRATLERTGDPGDCFDGIAYELSWWGKTQLDRMEHRAYQPIRVIVEIDGREHEAFTYVPLPSATPDHAPPQGGWIDSVIGGAIENGMTSFLDELRAAGAPVDAPRGPAV
jgi:hypothetical protein